MNSKDISTQKFEKVSFGYKQEDVDDYLNRVSAEFGQLERENAEINKKLQILADKVREYRQDEEAVKEALLDAKKAGHRTIIESKRKSDEIISEATIQAEKIINDAVTEAEDEVNALRVDIETEEKNLAKIQKIVSDFKKELFDMYKNHLELISSMPEIEDDDEDNEDIEADNDSVPDVANETSASNI
ncbi:MAG: DivIVA domain-containing protein [Ruminococcus sp.]|nr:DivIVA domain-containing protein [Ruminococcus sp.]